MLCVVASLVGVAPLLASGQDVLNDYRGVDEPTGGTIERCYPDADFAEALKLARSDEAQYGAAIDTIREKRADCRTSKATTVPADNGDGGGGATTIAFVVGGLLLVAAAGAGAVVARKRRHDNQFDEE